MNLLFIQHGSRVRYSSSGEPYVDGNFNNSVWQRYKSYCDNLHVILRRVEETFDADKLAKKMNWIDEELLTLKTVADIYSPKKNYFSLKIRKSIRKQIEDEVKWADKVILRSAGDFYTDIALKYCKKYKKPYLIEAVGFPFASFWYHSFFGKLIAFPIDIKFKKAVKNANYVLYVTEEALQKKYPSKGRMCGCSDVELTSYDFSEQELKNVKMNKSYKKIVLGTAAFLNVKWKGQIDVLKALSRLKKMGVTNFEYQLVGAGDKSILEKKIKKYNLENQVKIIGALPHNQVFDWLDTIDIYIQPSYQEGLCRSIVEAMSRGCAVICTNVGGNYELIDEKMIYDKGNVNELVNILSRLDKSLIVDQSLVNFNKSKKYEKKNLDKKRNEFYLEFVKNEKN